MDIKIYTTPTCGYCHMAKKYLSERGIPYVEYDVSRDRQAADEMVNLTGQMGVPVIVVDGQAIVGFDRQRLEQLIAGGGGSNRPRFGLKVADASKVAKKVGGLPVFGALVGAVAAGSPGERAGIKEGDIITEINMRPIRGADDLEKVLANLRVGGRVIIILQRGQQELRAEVVI
ncbi:MAG: Uxx-star family glutaredoxin-like (seleno)protein [Dehalococcoidia bacterium]